MIEITVEGRPAPKGSRIAARSKTGKPYTYAASKYEAPWVKAVAEATRQVMRHEDAIDPPYAVELSLFIAPLKSNPKAHPWPTRHDLDKLARAVIDGLVKGGAMEDDRHLIELYVTKRWAEQDEAPGVRCVVRAGKDQLVAAA